MRVLEDVEEEVEELAREEWEGKSGDHIRKTAAKQQSHRPRRRQAPPRYFAAHASLHSSLSRCLLDVLDSKLNSFLYFCFRCSTASQTTASLQGRLTQYGKSKRRAVPPALSSSVTRASHPISHAKFSDECIQIRSTGQHCSQLIDMAVAAGS